MVARGLKTPSFMVTGGSALMNSCRTAGSTTLAIWALAVDARKAAQKTSVPNRTHAVIAVRFAIMPWGRLLNDHSSVFGAAPDSTGSDSSCQAVQAQVSPAYTLLALALIIARARGARGYSIGHFSEHL